LEGRRGEERDSGEEKNIPFPMIRVAERGRSQSSERRGGGKGKIRVRERNEINSSEFFQEPVQRKKEREGEGLSSLL